MASSYSLDLRDRVVAFVEAGHSRRAAGRRFAVSESFSIKLVRRVAETGSSEPGRRGRPKGSGKLEAHAAFLVGIVEAEPDITMPELSARLVAAHATWRFHAETGPWRILPILGQVCTIKTRDQTAEITKRVGVSRSMVVALAAALRRGRPRRSAARESPLRSRRADRAGELRIEERNASGKGPGRPALAHSQHRLSIDSTGLRLDLRSADWARFSAKVAGANLHVVYDPDADRPIYAAVTPAKVNRHHRRQVHAD